MATKAASKSTQPEAEKNTDVATPKSAKTESATDNINTPAQIAQGERSLEFKTLSEKLGKLSDGMLEARASIYGITKRDGESWKQKIDAIAEAQLAEQGISAYEKASGQYANPQAVVLNLDPTSQRWPTGVRTTAGGDKVRTPLYGTGYIK